MVNAGLYEVESGEEKVGTMRGSGGEMEGKSFPTLRLLSTFFE